MLSTLLRNERASAAACIALAAGTALAYLLANAAVDMDAVASSRLRYALVMPLVWWAMMGGMMLPSAAPMILLFATFNVRQREAGRPHAPAAVFTAGYLLVWGAFSVLAAAVQAGFESAGALASAMTGASSGWLAGGLLLGAGVYQLTPLKGACLRHCRSPLQFAVGRWRPGWRGALRMGMEHGLYCMGCCWLLMALLFVGGMMSLYWVLGIAAYVLLEKHAPAGPWLSRGSGIALVASGAWLIANNIR